MANIATLINASVLSGDPAELERRLFSGGLEYVVIAEAPNCIPIPWMCCFRESDLQPITVQLNLMDGGVEPLNYSVPRTSVHKAKENLRGCLGVFEQMAGDSRVGKGYWLAALERLENLPLPYLTMNPLEVLLLNDPNEEALTLARCFSGLSASIPSMKLLTFFEDGFEPYSFEDYTSKSPDELDNAARLKNSRALDAMIMSPDDWYWHRRA